MEQSADGFAKRRFWKTGLKEQIIMTADHIPSFPDPLSPCIGVCVINPQTQWCDGCFRTLDEIAGWLNYSPVKKREVLAELDKRISLSMDSANFNRS
ncbi:MAG: DUF1289 domain-containing protein [Streptococcus sp.]|nr:DUF1289 domain-containing protein [Streptococcus sp.]